MRTIMKTSLEQVLDGLRENFSELEEKALVRNKKWECLINKALHSINFDWSS